MKVPSPVRDRSLNSGHGHHSEPREPSGHLRGPFEPPRRRQSRRRAATSRPTPPPRAPFASRAPCGPQKARFEAAMASTEAGGDYRDTVREMLAQLKHKKCRLAASLRFCRIRSQSPGLVIRRASSFSPRTPKRPTSCLVSSTAQNWRSRIRASRKFGKVRSSRGRKEERNCL